MAEIALLSAGAKIGYAVATEGDTRPTQGYTTLPNVTSLPSLDQAPNMIDVTRLSALKYTEKIVGLIDSGDSFGITANLTDEFVAAWDTLTTAAKGKTVFFCIEFKGMKKAFYFRGDPQPLGTGGAEPNQALKITANIAIETMVGWDASPTA